MSKISLTITFTKCQPFSISSSNTCNDLNFHADSCQGAEYNYIWAGSSFLLLVFYFFFIPEMKGRSLEELNEIFSARVPARDFSRYQCAIHEEIIHNVVAPKGGHGEVVEIEDVQAVRPSSSHV